MGLLADLGYEVVNLERAISQLRTERDTGGRTKAKTVVITFDDGFLDFFTEAFPILADRGYTATVFLPTAFIEKAGTAKSGKRFLSWSLVRELSALNISFGSHSVSHGQLAFMEADQVIEELQRSKEMIEEQTGKQIRSFSFPYAFPEHRRGFTTFLKTTLVDLGYLVAVTTCIGTATPDRDAFFLRRLPVNDDDDNALFQAKLTGAYNWLHTVQYVSKSVRGLLSLGNAGKANRWPCSGD